MGHLPIIDDCFRVSLIWSDVAGAHPVNVMHFSSSAGDEDSLASALDASWHNGQFGVVSTATSVVRYDILKLDGSAATKSYTPDPANSEGLEGQASGDPLLAYAVCVAFKTDFRGPRNRGRIFIGPLSENEVLAGTFVGVDNDVIAAQWSAFNTSLVGTADAWLHGVASYKGHTFTGISQYRADLFPATQRRRLTATR